ncbi:MAG: DUF427 domain-containing protein [Actinobacteria bacterium]|nr:DUF427 domain-containing protein [Actinomycetota bacterium]
MARRLPFGVVPDQPAPGQESVWDYPRPPLLERRDAEIVVVFGGVEVCRADHALLIKETSHPPTYYLPAAAWAPGALHPGKGGSICEWKGAAQYFDVVARSADGVELAVAPAAAWGYARPLPPYEALVNHVSVYPGRMDRVTVAGEPVRAQAGGFYGGWITSDVVGPFKGEPGSRFW